MNAAATPAVLAPETASEEQLISRYVAELAQLSPNGRLELLARLAQTLKSGAALEPVVSSPAFVGAWATDPEADKMEAAILTSRHFTAKPELENWS